VSSHLIVDSNLELRLVGQLLVVERVAEVICVRPEPGLGCYAGSSGLVLGCEENSRKTIRERKRDKHTIVLLGSSTKSICPLSLAMVMRVRLAGHFVGGEDIKERSRREKLITRVRK
jgi:hypothetical protein